MEEKLVYRCKVKEKFLNVSHKLKGKKSQKFLPGHVYTELKHLHKAVTVRQGLAQGGRIALSYDSTIQILSKALKQLVIHTKIKMLNDKGSRDL